GQDRAYQRLLCFEVGGRFAGHAVTVRAAATRSMSDTTPLSCAEPSRLPRADAVGDVSGTVPRGCASCAPLGSISLPFLSAENSRSGTRTRDPGSRSSARAMSGHAREISVGRSGLGSLESLGVCLVRW